MTPTEALYFLAAAGRIRSAWLPGMLTLQYGVPARLAWLDKAGRWNLSGNSGEWLRYASMDGIVLDPSDPATTGCLLALLREASGFPLAYVAPTRHGEGWCVTYEPLHPIDHIVHPTEHAAIVAALVAVAESL